MKHTGTTITNVLADIGSEVIVPTVLVNTPMMNQEDMDTVKINTQDLKHNITKAVPNPVTTLEEETVDFETDAGSPTTYPTLLGPENADAKIIADPGQTVSSITMFSLF